MDTSCICLNIADASQVFRGARACSACQLSFPSSTCMQHMGTSSICLKRMPARFSEDDHTSNSKSTIASSGRGVHWQSWSIVRGFTLAIVLDCQRVVDCRRRGRAPLRAITLPVGVKVWHLASMYMFALPQVSFANCPLA